MLLSFYERVLDFRRHIMRKIVLLAASMVATLAMCVGVSAADSVPSDVNLNNFKLSWSDEFDGTSLNDAYWTPQIGNGIEYGNRGWGNNEKEYYKAENVSVSNGTMKIKAQTEKTTANGTTYNWTSARITGTGKVNIGLGYVEAKIKIPSSKGIWPAFWMLGTNGKNWPACGEIDIMEAFNTRSDIQCTIHYPKWNGADQYIYTNKNVDNKTEWHTYGCYRDGKICAFYIDGQLLSVYGTWTDKYVRITDFNKTFSTADLNTGTYAGKRSVLNDDYYLLFNVACGGNLAQGNPPYDTSWNRTMEVDYVRYYKEKSPAEIAAEKKKQEEQQQQIEAYKQNVTMLVIDKKIMKLKEAGLPQSVIDNTPKMMRRSKLPIVKAKVGPQIVTLVCDQKIFDLVPVKKEVKATVSGIYLTSVKAVRGTLVQPENQKKKNWFKRNIEKLQEKAGAKPVK